MKTAKEVLTKYSDGDYTQFQGYGNILMAMNEYAKQYHKSRMKEIPEITDEEIESQAERLGEREDSNKQKFIDGNYFEGFVDCAKWYREELKKRMTK